jgi:hypothetical protein
MQLTTRRLKAGESPSPSQPRQPALPSSNKALVYAGAGAGVVVLVLLGIFALSGRSEPKSRPENLERRLKGAHDLYKEKKYPEADDVVHEILAKKELQDTTGYKDAAEFHVELHKLAVMERGARGVAPGWLDRAGRFLTKPTSANEGAALCDEGQRLLNEYPHCTFAPAIKTKVGNLERFKGEKKIQDSNAQFNQVAKRARDCCNRRMYGEAIKVWEELKGQVQDPATLNKISAQIQQIQIDASKWLQEVSLQAEQMRREDNVIQGMRHLKSAGAGLRGTASYAVFEERVRNYQTAP